LGDVETGIVDGSGRGVAWPGPGDGWGCFEAARSNMVQWKSSGSEGTRRPGRNEVVFVKRRTVLFQKRGLGKVPKLT